MSPGSGTAFRPAARMSSTTSLRVRLLGRQVAEGDVRPLAREGDRRRPADAAVAAGDERLAAGQPARPAVSFLAVVRRRIHLARQPGPRLLLLGERFLPVLGARVARCRR